MCHVKLEWSPTPNHHRTMCFVSTGRAQIKNFGLGKVRDRARMSLMFCCIYRHHHHHYCYYYCLFIYFSPDPSSRIAGSRWCTTVCVCVCTCSEKKNTIIGSTRHCAPARRCRSGRRGRSSSGDKTIIFVFEDEVLCAPPSARQRSFCLLELCRLLCEYCFPLFFSLARVRKL